MADGELTFGWQPEELQKVESKATLERVEWPPLDRTPREEFELRAMQHFNRGRQFWRHIVDGVELGILLLDNDGTAWSKTWIELERLPTPAEKGRGVE